MLYTFYFIVFLTEHKLLGAKFSSGTWWMPNDYL